MSKLLLRLSFVVALAVIAIAFRHFHLDDWLTLESLKSHRAELLAYYAEHRFSTIAIYFFIYVAVTAASLPGATILTLAGGALFGVLVGTVVVSFASTLGATGAFLLSRFVLRESVKRRFGGALAKIDAGIAKEGAFYLFSLRLIPLFPFFVINAAMGLTRMRIATYFLVSQVGMLLGTIAYVNAGTQLAQIESARGILSPQILISFSVLGMVPLVAKWIVEGVKARRAYRRYQRPSRYDYNVLVIGAGSAGLVASYIAATVRAKVGLVEKHRMGGDCLNTGCVPSKALIRTAKAVALRRRARELGLKNVAIDFDFADVMERVRNVVAKIAPHDSVERYRGLGVDCISGEAKLVSPFEVIVNGKTLTSKNIILATGASPLIPDLPGFDDRTVLTSDSVWSLQTLPRRLVVLGGGPIGCELGQAFARLGSEVTIVDRLDRLLPHEEEKISHFIGDVFRSEGIKLRLGTTVESLRSTGTEKQLKIRVGSQTETIEADAILCALGRRPTVKGFGLEELGVALNATGTIATDDFLRTNFPNIFVCGDVAGPYQFTHVASHQAWFASVNALFGTFKRFKIDYRVIPWTTFTDPEVARVGLDEREAAEKEIPVEVTEYAIDDLDRAIVDGENRGFVKVLTEPGGDRILGATIVGAHAGELIVEFISAMKHNIGLNKILGTIHIYPTFSEANKYAAGVWKKRHAPENLLKRLEKFHAWRRRDRKFPL